MERVVLLALLVLSAGCFSDPNPGQTGTTASSGTTAGESESETGEPACPDGSAGCDCYGNSTCDAELECEDGTCKLPECVAGSLNCDCYEGNCFTGLVCMDGTCKPEDAMPGCESVADCDANLCTQGDQTCEGACVAGVEVQCPLGATCDPQAGSCVCDPGTKPCGESCIPDTQCCSNADCGAGSTCAEGFCTCDGGLMCGESCIPQAQCCPGETSNLDCTCGAERQCSGSGVWSECMGGNPNPECVAGGEMACGNCGTQLCTANCTWTLCQGQGECMYKDEMCVNGKLEVCTEGCFWILDGAECV
jgi:hypothetical protein